MTGFTEKTLTCKKINFQDTFGKNGDCSADKSDNSGSYYSTSDTF
jgi:hypothetical protein